MEALDRIALPMDILNTWSTDQQRSLSSIAQWSCTQRISSLTAMCPKVLHARSAQQHDGTTISMFTRLNPEPECALPCVPSWPATPSVQSTDYSVHNYFKHLVAFKKARMAPTCLFTGLACLVSSLAGHVSSNLYLLTKFTAASASSTRLSAWSLPRSDSDHATRFLQVLVQSWRIFSPVIFECLVASVGVSLLSANTRNN
jgi:hypothetical protein